VEAPSWRNDGPQDTVDLAPLPIANPMANLGGAATLARDIAGEKQPEAAAPQADEHYRLLFECNPIPMWVFDRRTLRFLAVNEAAIWQYGYTRQEFLAKTILEIRPEEDFANVLADLATSRAGLQERGFWKHRRKNGELIDVEIVCHSLDFQGIEAMMVSAYDITARKRAEEVQQDSMNKYRVLFEGSGDAHWLMDEEDVLDCNSAARQMFGYSASETIPKPYDMSPPNQSDGTASDTAAKQKIALVLLNGKERFEWLHQRKNGEVFPAEVCLTRLTMSGRPVFLATVRDMTERKNAEEALLFKTALLEAQAESTIDGILAVDDSDCIILANKQFQICFDIPDEVLSQGDDAVLRAHVMGTIQGPEAFIEKIKYLNSHRNEKSSDELRLKNGKIFDRYSAPLVDSTGRYRGRIWYHRDITERKAAEERIQFLAYYDALTELPHRALLQDRMEIALADARRRGEKVAVMFIDLDQFKAINDSFGHSFGDILLREVARRIQDGGRGQDTVARVGGDEFVVLLSSAKDPADAAIAAGRVMARLNENFVIQGQSLNVSCSIGISMFPEHGADSETLIRNADAATYRAKSDGRNKVRFFTNEMNAEALERLTMDKNLRLALDREEFFLVYQPQVEIETGRITGFEALIRWQHPELGLVPPDRFISIAENNGLIVPIGEWVLRTACAQARRWQDAGLAAVPVAVNVSAVQFRQEGFTALVRRVLTETGLSAGSLELELTESLLLSNVDLVFATLQDLKEMGLQLAIDDFGTGYSSLSYLKRFPVDKLKIDRTFIRDIAVDSDDAAITTAIISMAKNLRLNVIAEGVETEEQMSFLREHKCDEIQGYYFSRPVPAADAASMLSAQACLARRKSAREPGGVSFSGASSFGSIRVTA
jgi:diguanylate cyclase (GGDEF)-like protein/PAS domain S-box-containing protein